MSFHQTAVAAGMVAPSAAFTQVVPNGGKGGTAAEGESEPIDITA